MYAQVVRVQSCVNRVQDVGHLSGAACLVVCRMKGQRTKTFDFYVAGLNHNALVRTLETTLMQPGIKQENVVVSSHAFVVVVFFF